MRKGQERGLRREAEMSSCVAFLGPSLSHEQARRIVGNCCDLLPPVKRGDLPSLPSSTRVIAIIDGVFQSESSVGHREILEQLRRGVDVVGGGSMGALRASELDSMGMTGIGEVYKLYASGRIDGDDEVALIFNPETLEALSEPLVNMRHNLQKAVARSIIRADDCGILLAKMKSIYFPKRTKGMMIDLASTTLETETLSKFEEFVRDDYIDIKMKDAEEVLRYVIKSAEKIEKINKKRSKDKHP
jgi:TfuA protein